MAIKGPGHVPNSEGTHLPDDWMTLNNYMAVCEPCKWSMGAETKEDAHAFLRLHKIVSDNHRTGFWFKLKIKFMKGMKRG